MTDGVPALAMAAPRKPWILAWLAGALRAERLMWQEAACRLLRRPLPSVAYAGTLGPGRRFALHRGSFSSVLLPMIMLSSCVDVPLCHGAIHVMIPAPDRLPLHMLTLVANLWTLAWAASLRSAVRHVDHVLSADRLVLAIGFRHLACIPLAAIRELHLVDRKATDWGAAQKLRNRDVTVLSPIDAPTLLIALHPHAGARWEKAGAERRLRPWIAVYVDQPGELKAALEAALAANP